MEDNSFEQAIDEAIGRVRQDIRDEVIARGKWVLGNTVDSLVEDMAGNPLQKATQDVLLLLKMIVLVELAKERQVLEQEEVDELSAHLAELQTVSTNRPQ